MATLFINRSHYRSSDELSTIIYGPDMEKTDDVVNRNTPLAQDIVLYIFFKISRFYRKGK